MDNSTQDLELLIRSRVPLIVVETHDEPQVVALFRRLTQHLNMPVMRWSVAAGLQRIDLDLQSQTPVKSPDQVLAQIKNTATPGIYLLLDFHPYFEDSAVVRQIREIALGYGSAGHTLVFVSHTLHLPPELHAVSARFDLELPDSAKLEQIIREEARQWVQDHPDAKIKTDDETLRQLVRRLAGLAEIDARRLVRKAIYDDGAITRSDLTAVLKARYELADQSGALSLELDTAGFADIGGLDHLKRWLIQRRTAFAGTDMALDRPKGILLVGVQGSGKSLAAKAVAGVWGLPLLRLDFGALYNKFFGETERNIRQALKTAESMSPCVLWIDEIEKAIAGGDYDSGTSKRVLGTLLTWLSERSSPVFLVATANRIDQLPPELIRKGRLDEIFFVDLPDATTRARIFDIHLRKRNLESAEFDLKRLAEGSQGFSGAEIEQAVVAALYLAREQNRPLDTGHLISELSQTRPLSRVMTEQVQALRAWARDRTVAA